MADDAARASWRRPATFVLVAILILLSGHGAAWWWATGEIEDAWPRVVATAKSYGWEVSGGSPVRGGWPWAASVRRPDILASRPFGDATLRLKFDGIALRLSPADLRAVRVEALGTLTATVGNGPGVELRADSAVLRTPLDGVGPVALAVKGLLASGPGIGPGGGGASGLALMTLDAVLEGASVSASARGVQARPPLPSPFEAGGSMALRFVVTPPFPVAATPALSARQWQAAGGRVSVPELMVRWGPLAIDGHAAGGLDAALQPELQGILDTQGAPDLLEAAAKAGVVAKPVAQAARAVLSILTMSAGSGPVRLPVTLSDGALAVAKFPLARLPRVDWGPP